MRICLDPGHGGHAAGATFSPPHGDRAGTTGGSLIREKDITLLVCLCLEKILAARGHEVILTRDFDFDVPLNMRAEIANEAGADIFISIHVNADPDDDSAGQPEAGGEEIWIYPGSEGGRNLAAALGDCVDLVFPGSGFRGIKTSGTLAVLRETAMPAALIELGFMDNIEEIGELCNPGSYTRIARLIAEGIEIYKGGL